MRVFPMHNPASRGLKEDQVIGYIVCPDCGREYERDSWDGRTRESHASAKNDKAHCCYCQCPSALVSRNLCALTSPLLASIAN